MRIGLTVGFMFFSIVASAATIRVPDDQPTIQAGESPRVLRRLRYVSPTTMRLGQDNSLALECKAHAAQLLQYRLIHLGRGRRLDAAAADLAFEN